MLEQLLNLIYETFNTKVDEYELLCRQEATLKEISKQIQSRKTVLEQEFKTEIAQGAQLCNEKVLIKLEQKEKYKIADSDQFCNWCYNNGFSEKVKLQVAPATMASIAKKSPLLPDGITKTIEQEIVIVRKI